MTGLDRGNKLRVMILETERSDRMRPDTAQALYATALSLVGCEAFRGRLTLDHGGTDSSERSVRALAHFLLAKHVHAVFHDELQDMRLPGQLEKSLPGLRQFVLPGHLPVNAPTILRPISSVANAPGSIHELALKELPDGGLESNFLHLDVMHLTNIMGRFDPDLKVYRIGPNDPVIFRRQFVHGKLSSIDELSPRERGPRKRGHPLIEQVEFFLGLEPISELVIAVDGLMPHILPFAAALPLSGERRLVVLQSHVGELLSHRHALEQSLVEFKKKNYYLRFDLKDLKSFAENALQLHGHPVSPKELVGALQFIRYLSLKYPGDVENRLEGEFVLFNPWLGDEGILQNGRFFVYLDFVTDFCRRAPQTRLWLKPGEPLWVRSKQEGLLVQGGNAGVKWRFVRSRMAAVLRETLRLYVQSMSSRKKKPFGDRLFPNYTPLLGAKKALGQITDKEIGDPHVLLRQRETFDRLSLLLQESAHLLARRDPLGDTYFRKALGFQALKTNRAEGTRTQGCLRETALPGRAALRNLTWSDRKPTAEKILFMAGSKKVLVLQVLESDLDIVLRRYAGFPTRVGGSHSWDPYTQDQSLSLEGLAGPRNSGIQDPTQRRRVDVYVARSERDLDAAVALDISTEDPAAVQKLGQLLGYPPCCIRSFVSYGLSSNNTFLLYQSVLNSRGKYHWELNIGLPHVLCSFRCRESRVQAMQVLNWHFKSSPNDTRRLKSILGLPRLLINHHLSVSFEGALPVDHGLNYEKVLVLDSSGVPGLRRAVKKNVLDPLRRGNRVVNERDGLWILDKEKVVFEMGKEIPGINPLLIFS